jgi:hypothetical protein
MGLCLFAVESFAFITVGNLMKSINNDLCKDMKIDQAHTYYRMALKKINMKQNTIFDIANMCVYYM